MQAIIMAAGKGSRLGNITQDKPKSFVEINGIKLLEYNIAMLHEYGIKDIVVVTGYKTEKIEQLCKNYEGIRCVFNPFYESVNVLGSFYIGQSYINDDFIYMHADTLCSPVILKKLLNKKADMVLPIDFKICDEEAMKVRVVDDIVIDISKKIEYSISDGEFIGIAKISKNVLSDVKNATKILMQNKKFDSYFEATIKYMIENQKFKPVAIATEGEFWGEIDFVEDYNRVCVEISKELIEIAGRNIKC